MIYIIIESNIKNNIQHVCNLSRECFWSGHDLDVVSSVPKMSQSSIAQVFLSFGCITTVTAHKKSERCNIAQVPSLPSLVLKLSFPGGIGPRPCSGGFKFSRAVSQETIVARPGRRSNTCGLRSWTECGLEQQQKPLSPQNE